MGNISPLTYHPPDQPRVAVKSVDIEKIRPDQPDMLTLNVKLNIQRLVTPNMPDPGDEGELQLMVGMLSDSSEAQSLKINPSLHTHKHNINIT